MCAMYDRYVTALALHALHTGVSPVYQSAYLGVCLVGTGWLARIELVPACMLPCVTNAVPSAEVLLLRRLVSS